MLPWLLSLWLNYVLILSPPEPSIQLSSALIQVTLGLEAALIWVIWDFEVHAHKISFIQVSVFIKVDVLLSFFYAATWQWLSSVRFTPGRPSPALMSPSTKPHSPWPSDTTRSTPHCPTCLLKAARCQTRTAGWPIVSLEHHACPRTTWPGPSATSPTERRRPTAAWRSVPDPLMQF